MKATGIVRRVDDLGRVVIPKEFRDAFRLNAGHEVQFVIDRSRIVLTPVKNALFDPQFGEVLGQKYGHAFGIYSSESRVQGVTTPVDVPETWTHYCPTVNKRFEYCNYHVYPVVSTTTDLIAGYIVIPGEIDNYSYTTAIVDLLSKIV